MGLFSSNKSSSVSNLTENNFYDNRQVNDAGGGILGTGNAWDQSINMLDASSRSSWADNSLSMTDASSRSSWADNSLSMTDASSRSSWADYSNRSTTTINNVDGGAFSIVGSVADGLSRIGLAQVDAARAIAASGTGLGTEAVQLATLAQERAAGFNTLAANRAFDLANSSQAGAWDAFQDVLGMAKDVTTTAGQQAAQAATVAQAAYQGAADTASGNKTIIYAALAVVAAVGLVAAFRG